MAQGTVKSTQEAIEAIQRMTNTLQGGLVDALNQFKADGDSLNIENFDGARAAAFYSEWPDTKTALATAVERLTAITDEIMSANQDIQAAGGNE
jgi:uncharacterized protein YukE